MKPVYHVPRWVWFYVVIIGVIIWLLTSCATTRQTSYVQPPVTLPDRPVELAISMVVLTLIIIIGLSSRQQ